MGDHSSSQPLLCHRNGFFAGGLDSIPIVGRSTRPMNIPVPTRCARLTTDEHQASVMYPIPGLLGQDFEYVPLEFQGSDQYG